MASKQIEMTLTIRVDTREWAEEYSVDEADVEQDVRKHVGYVVLEAVRTGSPRATVSTK